MNDNPKVENHYKTLTPRTLIRPNSVLNSVEGVWMYLQGYKRKFLLIEEEESGFEFYV